MNINEKYKSKLISILGEIAIKWFEELPIIIEECKVKWKLSDLKPYEDLSYNYVCSAKSEIYGDVVLKTGFPSKELYTEIDSLSDFEADYVCDIYDFDKSLNAMLLECLRPGETLWSVSSDSEKIKIAAPILEATPTIVEDTSKYPTYISWIDGAVLKFQKRYDSNHRMNEHHKNIKSIYNDLNTKGNELHLIHGDLHHSNIISSNGVWKVIDPKGVIAYKSLEVGRFMNNHYPSVDEEKREEQLELMLDVFSKEFKLSKEIILRSFYIDDILSLTWTFESEVLDMEYINKKMYECDILYKYIIEKTLT